MNVVTLPRRDCLRHKTALRPPALPEGRPPESDRLALLRAIAAESHDDTPRLVYADWLDDYGEGDLDRATVEFLRAGCDGVTRRPDAPILPAARHWLLVNWWRLVPAFLALADPPAGCPPYFAHWSGRSLLVRIHLSGRLRWWETAFVFLYFRRGFVDRVHTRSDPAAGLVAPAVRADQPFAELLPRRPRGHALAGFCRPHPED